MIRRAEPKLWDLMKWSLFVSCNSSLHLSDLLQQPPGESSQPSCQSLTLAKLLKQTPGVVERGEAMSRWLSSQSYFTLAGEQNVIRRDRKFLLLHLITKYLDASQSNSWLDQFQSEPQQQLPPFLQYVPVIVSKRALWISMYSANAFLTLFHAVKLLRGNVRPKHGVNSVVRNGSKLSLNVQFIRENGVWWFSQREAPRRRFSLLTGSTTKSGMKKRFSLVLSDKPLIVFDVSWKELFVFFRCPARKYFSKDWLSVCIMSPVMDSVLQVGRKKKVYQEDC